MITHTVYQAWYNATFRYLKSHFSNLNEGWIEDAILQAYYQMAADYNAPEPRLSISLNTLKQISRCRLIDYIRKERNVCMQEVPNCADTHDYDPELDILIEAFAQKVQHLCSRQQELLVKKYKILPQSVLLNMSDSEIYDFINQEECDADIAENCGYPSSGSVRAARCRALQALRGSWNFWN
jgi:hypothetical protein